MKKTFLFDNSDKRIFEYFSAEKDKASANFDELILNNHLHPHGIKELMEPKQIRVAKSILLLLHAMDKGTIDDRLQALHSLRDEVLICSENSMPQNTARVLLSIMKDFARTTDETHQLELLHDFTMMMHAKSRTVRKYLTKYNLLEMPEEWNQLAFDHHVHDSYTKGRKTPTHLIMDAWIKGIRRITVVYYDFVQEDAVRELLTAALYMNIKVRIGIECSVRYNEKKVNFIWTPENLPDVNNWMDFLHKPEVMAFTEKACAKLLLNQQITKTTAMYNSPNEFFLRLDKIDTEYHITLTLSGLDDIDVLELLYDCNGKINNIEVYNTKDLNTKQAVFVPKIKKIRKCINEKNTAKMKVLIKKMINNLKDDESENEKKSFHIKKLNDILIHLDSFFMFYKFKSLYDRWGTDSIGKASQERNGMGFAILETLPHYAQKIVRKNKEKKLLPIHIQTMYRENFMPITGFRLPFMSRFKKINSEWIANPNSDNKGKNLVALGEYDTSYEQKLEEIESRKKKSGILYTWKYMPTGLKNWIKFTIGFIPAFASFFFTKKWWVLMYLGAPIWFFITGLRNIIQAVVSGDSRHRSPLLRWTGYIKWNRIADSLFWTGFSVPLIDFFVKTWLLEQKLSITTSTNPLMAFTIMSIVNGLYVSGHNLIRGLPKSDVIWNFFRSILSIPLALLLNSGLGFVLTIAAVPGIEDILQKWAAIISKLASDTVGGIIEGLSTRQKNIKLRHIDYRRKFEHMQRTCRHLEFMFPKRDLSKVLKNPKNAIEKVLKENPRVFKSMVFDALDFFYFWLFQPHARTVLISMLKKMNKRNRNLFLNFQNILSCRDTVSALLIDGLSGYNFKLILRLYLEHSSSYLKTMSNLMKGGKWDDSAETINQEEYECSIRQLSEELKSEIKEK